MALVAWDLSLSWTWLCVCLCASSASVKFSCCLLLSCGVVKWLALRLCCCGQDAVCCVGMKLVAEPPGAGCRHMAARLTSDVVTLNLWLRMGCVLLWTWCVQAMCHCGAAAATFGRLQVHTCSGGVHVIASTHCWCDRGLVPLGSLFLPRPAAQHESMARHCVLAKRACHDSKCQVGQQETPQAVDRSADT